MFPASVTTPSWRTGCAVDERDLVRRRSFNERADEYRLGRPPYPSRVFDLLRECCGLTAGSQVLEIGAGSGLAAI
jgi:protein-L-isoaspartate O-methyltransferase